MLITSIKELHPHQLKESDICSSAMPLRIWQYNIRHNWWLHRIQHNTQKTEESVRPPRSPHPSIQIKMLTSARKSTPHPARALTSLRSNQVQYTKLPVCDQGKARCYRDLAPALIISVTAPRYISAAPNLLSCWLVALLIENPLHAGNILGKDRHTLSHL